MMVTERIRVSPSGECVLPEGIVEQLHLQDGGELVVRVLAGKVLVAETSEEEDPLQLVAELQAEAKARGYKPEDVQGWVDEARAELHREYREARRYDQALPGH